MRLLHVLPSFLLVVLVLYTIAAIRLWPHYRRLKAARALAGARTSAQISCGRVELERTVEGAFDISATREAIRMNFEGDPGFSVIPEGDGLLRIRQLDLKRALADPSWRGVFTDAVFTQQNGGVQYSLRFSELRAYYLIRLGIAVIFCGILAWLPLKPNISALGEHRWIFFVCLFVTVCLAFLGLFAEQATRTDFYLQKLIVTHGR